MLKKIMGYDYWADMNNRLKNLTTQNQDEKGDGKDNEITTRLANLQDKMEKAQDLEEKFNKGMRNPINRLKIDSKLYKEAKQHIYNEKTAIRNTLNDIDRQLSPSQNKELASEPLKETPAARLKR